jgi:RNA polymerase sigma-70 factor (ECF subfamily)
MIDHGPLMRQTKTPTMPPTDPPSWPAFEAEALPHAEGLFRLAMWLERDRGEAEDLVQETYTRALESFHRYKSGTNCRAWLVTILQYVRSNRRRARGRALMVADSEERIAQTIAIVPPVPERLTDEDVLSALRRLPSKYQEIVLLSDVEELSYKEIAEVLTIPIGTVMSRLHRGRAILRVELADYATAHGVSRAEGT